MSTKAPCFLPTIILLFFTVTICAQDFNDYTPIKSSGQLPEDFTKLSTEKYEENKSEIDRSKKKSTRKAEDAFYRMSSYYIDKLLLSGNVLFNDPLTQYVEKVGNKILESEPELQGKIRFYTVKSSAVNAITTNDGIVFVTIGLLAQLSNEAQLAYILSHEVVHYKNRHVISSYVEGNKIEKGKSDYRNISTTEKLLAKSAYSKELELEADEEGIDIFLASGYDPNVIDGVFDVLQFSYLPFDEVEFDRSYLETENIKLPEEYFLEKLDGITFDESMDDEGSTHPAIPKRRSAVNRAIKNAAKKGEKYIISEEEFEKTRDVARFELVKIYLQQRDYGNALYATYLLQKKYPNSKYLAKAKVKSLYGISKYKNAGGQYDVLINYKKIEGSSQQVFYLLKKLSKEEASVLAVTHSWKAKQQFPEDDDLNDIADDALRELVFEHNKKPNDYSKVAKDTAQKELESAMDTLNEKELSKYEKIKLQKKKETVIEEDDFTAFAFVKLFEDDEFAEEFDRVREVYNNKSDEPEMTYSEKQKLRRTIQRRGYSLGIDKIVIIDPLYAKIDQRKSEQVRFMKSESGQQALADKFTEVGKQAKLDIDVINTKDFSAENTESYNDMAMLYDWADERLDHGDDVDMIASNQYLLPYLKAKYNTKYFALAGVITLRESKDLSDYYTFCLYVGLVYTAPIGIYKILKPEYSSLYYFLLYDIETGEKVFTSAETFNNKDRNDLINSYLYDTLFQIKKESKNP